MKSGSVSVRSIFIPVWKSSVIILVYKLDSQEFWEREKAMLLSILLSKCKWCAISFMYLICIQPRLRLPFLKLPDHFEFSGGNAFRKDSNLAQYSCWWQNLGLLALTHDCENVYVLQSRGLFQRPPGRPHYVRKVVTQGLRLI